MPLTVMSLLWCYKWAGFNYITEVAKYKYVIKTSSLQSPLIIMHDISCSN
jgi:hypothetical protein